MNARAFPPLAVLLLVAVAGVAPRAPGEPASSGPAASRPATSQPGAPTTQEAVADLTSDDWILQASALRQLARARAKEAAPQIRQVLTGAGQPWVRGRALVALAELQGRDVLQEVQSFAADKLPELRAAAMDALGFIGDAAGAPAVAAGLKDPDPQVRHRAVVALARLKGRQAWEVVRPMLDAKDVATVRHAAEALVYINTPEAQQALIALLAHAEGDVRLAAAAALGEAKTPESLLPLLTRMTGDTVPEVRAACQDALVSFDLDRLLDPLGEVLRSDRKELYPAVIKVLAARPVPQVGKAVAEIAQGGGQRYGEVLPDVLALLGRVDADAYREVFQANLAHAAEKVRAAAVAALARCNCDLYEPLRPLLIDKDAGVRTQVYHVLTNLAKGTPKGGVVAYLADALAHPDNGFSLPAVEFLRGRVTAGELPKALELLDRFLAGGHDPARQQAARALARVADDENLRRICIRQGYLSDWQVIGTFPAGTDQAASLARVYPPEIELDFKKKYPRYLLGYGSIVDLADASSGGVARQKALRLAPPRGDDAGKTLVGYYLQLPEAKAASLRLTLGAVDPPPNGPAPAGEAGNPPPGLIFSVRVDGAEVLAKKLPKAEGWQELQADLSAFAGKSVWLELVCDGQGDGRAGIAALGEASIVADDKTVAELVALLPSAAPRNEVAGKEGTIGWETAHPAGVQGWVALNELLSPPTDHRLGYAVCDIRSPADASVLLTLDANDGFALWLDGKKLAEKPAAVVAEKLKARLHRGQNRLMVKVTNLTDSWGFSLRVTDEKSNRIDALLPGK